MCRYGEWPGFSWKEGQKFQKGPATWFKRRTTYLKVLVIYDFFNIIFPGLWYEYQ